MIIMIKKDSKTTLYIQFDFATPTTVPIDPRMTMKKSLLVVLQFHLLLTQGIKRSTIAV